MINWIRNFFSQNWQQKIMAVVIATIIWAIANHTMISTKVIQDIPVHIVNLPPDMTANGLLPNNYLADRITLTLTGKKSSIDDIQPNDLEVVLDATGKKDEWIVNINKKNIISSNQEIDINNDINKITHNELIIKLSPLHTEEILIKINKPSGEPPAGYQYLDVWPQYLTYTLSGPSKPIKELKEKGLQLTFDLADITKAELDAIQTSSSPYQQDEVVFFIPDSWKKIAIPFHNNALEQISDPEARKLHITFLRKNIIALDGKLPVELFFPTSIGDNFNPQSYNIEQNIIFETKNGITLLNTPLYIKDVSQLFLDVVRNHLQLVIVVDPMKKDHKLDWSVQFINPQYLEDKYISLLRNSKSTNRNNVTVATREEQLRQRFRHYMRKFELLKNEQHPLKLKMELKDTTIQVKEI